jgi:hypothetical protein
VELKRRTVLHNLCAKHNLLVIRNVHKRSKRPLMTCVFNWILLLNYTDVRSINLNRPTTYLQRPWCPCFNTQAVRWAGSSFPRDSAHGAAEVRVGP